MDMSHKEREAVAGGREQIKEQEKEKQLTEKAIKLKANGLSWREICPRLNLARYNDIRERIKERLNF